MPNITDLPQDVLNIIFDYLSARSLRSVSLTTRSWSQAYKQRCCRSLQLELSSDNLQSKIALFKRWEKLGLLGSVHDIIIVDHTGKSRDANDTVPRILKDWLPRCTRLKAIKWDFSKNPKPTSATELSNVPRGVWLDLICGGQVPVQCTSSFLSVTQFTDGLRSLAVEFDGEDEATLGPLLKATLLGCENIRKLKIHVTSVHTEPGSGDNQIGSADECSLSWTPEEARNLPALHILDLHYPTLAEATFKSWAENGDWTALQTLIAHHSWTLEHLTARLPALRALSVSTFDALSSFLEQQRGIRSFAVANVKTSLDTEAVNSSLRSILQQPFAATLNELDLRLTRVNEEEQQPTIDVRAIAECCSQLHNLTIALDRGQYTNAVGYFCWLDACIETVIRMPKLLHLCIIVPRLILSGSISIPPEFITLGTASEIRSKLASHGKHIQEVRIVALMDEEIAQSERETAVLQYLSAEKSALTFIAAPAEKDWDAEHGIQTVSCPELERAEALLSAGHTSRLHPTGDYSLARRTIDDISTFAHVGTIVPKKKPRPMPVWLTPWQEQDRREGPPGPARRAKRAAITTMDGFLGTWRLPMAERARTAAEKEARETGIGGRPGWSKSSLATRMFWSR